MPASIPPSWPFFELFGYPLHQAEAIHREIESQRFQCPFLQGKCQKKSHAFPTIPSGTCSILKAGRPIIICPYRFQGNNLKTLHTVADQIWPGKKTSRVLVPNVKLAKAGNVDWFIVRPRGKAVEDFIGVEIQAIDITGSVQPALERFRKKLPAAGEDKFGINYKNVSKRMLPQLLEKGRCFKSWGKKLAVVVQDRLFEDLSQRLGLKSIPLPAADIAFFVWSFHTHSPSSYSLELAQVFGMSHESLLTHIMYSDLPSLEEIKSKLKERMSELGY